MQDLKELKNPAVLEWLSIAYRKLGHIISLAIDHYSPWGFHALRL